MNNQSDFALTNEEAIVSEKVAYFEKALFAGQPAWETQAEYAAHVAWMDERTPYAKAFKAALVAKNMVEARRVAGEAVTLFGLTFKK